MGSHHYYGPVRVPQGVSSLLLPHLTHSRGMLVHYRTLCISAPTHAYTGTCLVVYLYAWRCIMLSVWLSVFWGCIRLSVYLSVYLVMHRVGCPSVCLGWGLAAQARHRAVSLLPGSWPYAHPKHNRRFWRPKTQPGLCLRLLWVVLLSFYSKEMCIQSESHPVHLLCNGRMLKDIFFVLMIEMAGVMFLHLTGSDCFKFLATLWIGYLKW